MSWGSRHCSRMRPRCAGLRAPLYIRVRQLLARNRVQRDMRYVRALAVACVCLTYAAGQTTPPAGPVVSPRGVRNAFTKQPAPATVAPGALIVIEGLNLGPAAAVRAAGPAWPLKLGDVEVFVNNRAAPTGFVEPGRILAQVPWDTPPGLVEVVVRRGDASSRAARFFVTPVAPSLRSADDTGSGAAAVVRDGSAVTVAASGLGATDPPVASGETGSAPPRTPIRAFLGGLPLNASVTASAARVGEFDISFPVPAGAAAGDLLSVAAGGRAANRLPLTRLPSPEMLYLPFSEGTPEIRSLTSTDLRGTLLVGSGARAESGCYRAWVFDMAARTTSPLDDCVTSANRQIPSPVIAAQEGAALAAFIGPPLGEAPEPVSARVKIVAAGRAEPMVVDLPSAATVLTSNAAGNFIASLGQSNAVEIDARSGEVREIVPGTGAGIGNLNNFRIDAGEGFSVMLTAAVQAGQGMFLAIVADDEDHPTKAKLVAVNARGEVQDSRNFPDGWVPLIPPAPQLPGGAQLPAGAGNVSFARQRLAAQFDAPSRSLLVIGRTADDAKHGIVSFTIGDNGGVRAAAFPDGWFAATCSARVPFYNLELSRRLAIHADRSSANAIRNPCSAQGYVLYDLAQGTAQAVALPGQGQMNAGANADDINDFLYATDIDPSNAGRAETVFLLDGVTQTAFRFDPPANVGTINQLVPVRELNLLVALGTNRSPGDAGLVLFDIEAVATRVLPVPEGFTAVQFLSVFPSTGKLVARGIRAEGAQLLVYDLKTGDLAVPANPEGVAFIGPPVQTGAAGPGPGFGGGGGGQGPGPGQFPRGGGAGGGGAIPVLLTPAVQLRANAKANTVEAIAFNASRQQVGVVVLRVP